MKNGRTFRAIIDITITNEGQPQAAAHELLTDAIDLMNSMDNCYSSLILLSDETED